ncbi:hypothetical protein GCM10007860_34350 [Chitiniphilus shinanonensis]|uniref:STAS domain-containing protein n=1 Tax=Chitiniphilus shinanonensis TaxID=553088 RepID=A0ABQ6BXN1_9NEIS|nr:STAS domain-containing protein [Chitiniphilus shinanonensis]GLS06259.1 hypothetical protein GCM10007860_34350 [Chitiniphilus shinanonensis]
MFSFFRKKDNEPEKPESPKAGPKPAPTPAPESPSPATGEPPAYNLQELSIEVEDIGAHLTPAEEEAVVLYANNQAEAAIEALKGILPTVLGTRRHETWHLLFELYQQQGNRAAYDELALQYVVEFEVSPPVWRDLPRRAATAETPGSAYVAFPAQIKAEVGDKEAAKLIKACEKGAVVRVDFSRVTDIDSLGAAETLACWSRARKNQTRLQILGADSFAELLRAKIEPSRKIPAEAPFWLLLLEVMQSTGDQDAFDNLAIVYAVTFEVSPPSWDAKLAPSPEQKAAQQQQPAAAPTPSRVAPDHLLLAGDLVGGATADLSTIREFAAQHASPVLDFKGVRRVDFETAGQLLNLCMELMQQGHVLAILDPNELVTGLLHLLGVSELVELRYSHPRR